MAADATLKMVVLASGNAHKLQEMRARLQPPLALRPQTEWHVSPAEETGATFLENALIKARHCAAMAGLPSLADDSGLSVAALQGAPGVRSARYANKQASDAENNARLLDEMAGLPADCRLAVFHCTLILCRSADDPDPFCAQGRWRGHIAEAPSGDSGFGYDPLFIPQGETVSAACLSAATKNSISHRGLAMDVLLEQIKGWR